ncbi:hypothetical protein Tco_1193312 [Tanacetum coccineum]
MGFVEGHTALLVTSSCIYRQHDPDYVPEPVYPEYIPLEDEHEFLAEEQPLPPIDSPTTEPVIPHPVCHYYWAKDNRSDPRFPISLPPEAKRLARCTAPPAHSPPVPPSSGCLTQIQTLRITSTQALSLSIEAVTTALNTHLHSTTTTILYPCPSPVSHAEERRQGIRDVGYGIRDTWVDPAEAVPEIAPMTVGEVNTRVVELAELHERDTQDLYALLEDAQDSRSRMSQRVDMNSQRVDLLMGDRMTLQETVWMVEEEAYASREAWARSIGLSQATHQELQTHRDHVYAHETYLQAHQTQLQLQSTLIQTQHQVHETRFHMQQTELAAFRETDRRRQDQMVETLRVIREEKKNKKKKKREIIKAEIERHAAKLLAQREHKES